MTYDLGQTVGVQMLKALGLPTSHCLGLTIEVKPDEVVVAKATYAADLGEVIEIIKRLKPEAAQ